MITLDEYFHDPRSLDEGLQKPHFPHQEVAALDLLTRVNALIDEAEASARFKRIIDLDTGCEISGVHGGAGDGGFRAPTTTTGAGGSSHREGKGVDAYDPGNLLDDWLSEFDKDDGKENEMLAKHGLYREHPSKTEGWCHLTTRAPGSGKRTFMP